MLGQKLGTAYLLRRSKVVLNPGVTVVFGEKQEDSFCLSEKCLDTGDDIVLNVDGVEGECGINDGLIGDLVE